MKTRVLVLVFFFGISIACNNFCNGHGSCGQLDKCECYPGWGGADCSLRACPYDEAFIDLIRGDLNHDGQIGEDEVKSEWYPKAGISENMASEVTSTRAHRYAECSNVGLCDRTTGDCKCFPGYEGSACQRHSCPTAVEGTYCSGHGICESAGDEYGNAAKEANWEFNKFYKCKCDKGWEGIMCDKRICPTGIDPVVQKSHDFTFSYDITLDSTNRDFSTYYVINYDGVKYTTPIVTAGNINCNDGESVELSKAANIQEDIRRSLMVVPPLTQSSVLVKCADGTTANKLSVTITTEYADVNKYIEQCDLDEKPNDDVSDDMFVVYKYDDGSKEYKPMEYEVKYGSSLLGNTPATNDCNDVVKKITESQVSAMTCSNRGICNGETGLCECYTGYYGLACENLRSYLV